MNETPESETKRKSRLRWVTLGEAIALAALIVSAVGVWLSWRGDEPDNKPATVVERRTAIPLTLRGRVGDDGRRLQIAPVESGHALQSLLVRTGTSAPIDVGGEGELSAEDLERALGDKAPDGKDTQRIRVEIAADYVEAGADKSATGSYVISFRWNDDGLLRGRSLRFVGFARA